MPGCPGRATGGPCPVHAGARARARGGATAQGYTSRWEVRAKTYLFWHPWCALCGHPATIPDHHPRSRRQLVRAGVPDPDADMFLRPLCEPCHRSQTGVNQPGGWHAQRL